MRMLVTGGAGFIGSDFIRYWLNACSGDKIINLDALTYAGNPDNLAEVRDNADYEFVHGDICDAGLVRQLAADADMIVHFAAETHVDRSIADSSAFVRTNVEGTRVLLEAARQAGNIRFHHISTDEVYGALQPGDPEFNEKTPYNPRSPYSASKAASDHLARAYFHTYGLPVTISNCSNNYGPGQHPEKLIPLAISRLQQGGQIPIYGQGQNIRDWIHVRDHNKGVAAIIAKGRIGETYCLGGGNEIKNIDLARLIAGEFGLGEEAMEFVADRPGHDFRYAIDSGKARTELDWRPEKEFRVGIQETISWYRSAHSKKT